MREWYYESPFLRREIGTQTHYSRMDTQKAQH